MKRVFSKLKIWFKNAKEIFILTILTFIIFSITTCEEFRLDVSYWAIFLYSIPFIVCLIITIFTNIFKKRFIKILSNFLAAFLVIFLPFYYILTTAYLIIDKIENPVIDIKYYTKYYNYIGSLRKAFPKEIPESATNVEFKYYPGFLQSGNEYSLYYMDENITLDEFDSLYKNKAEWMGNIDNYKLKPGLLGNSLNIDNIKSNDNDFTIYLIESSCDDSGYCNHGKYIFAAINEETHEIIYKMDMW